MENPTNTFFLGVHEAYETCKDGPDVPAGAPGLSMVMCEGGADVFVDFKPAVFSDKFDFRRREGIIVGEFEDAMIESPLEILFQSIQAKMENEGIGS